MPGIAPDAGKTGGREKGAKIGPKKDVAADPRSEAVSSNVFFRADFGAFSSGPRFRGVRSYAGHREEPLVPRGPKKRRCC